MCHLQFSVPNQVVHSVLRVGGGVGAGGLEDGLADSPADWVGLGVPSDRS